jgi:hypothetical protein
MIAQPPDRPHTGIPPVPSLQKLFAGVSREAGASEALTRHVMVRIDPSPTYAQAWLANLANRLKAGSLAVTGMALICLCLGGVSSLLPGMVGDVPVFASLSLSGGVSLVDLGLSGQGYPLGLLAENVFAALIPLALLITLMWVLFSLLIFPTPAEFKSLKEEIA